MTFLSVALLLASLSNRGLAGQLRNALQTLVDSHVKDHFLFLWT